MKDRKNWLVFARCTETYEFDEGVEVSKYFYEPKEIKTANGLDVTGAAEKKRLEEKQAELYAFVSLTEIKLDN